MKKIVEKFGNRVLLLGVCGLICVILALTLSFALEPKLLGWKVIFAGIAELGFAALIAVAIILTIDHHEKDRFKKEIEASHARLVSSGMVRCP